MSECLCRYFIGKELPELPKLPESPVLPKLKTRATHDFAKQHRKPNRSTGFQFWQYRQSAATTASSLYTIRLSTSAEFFDPKAMQLHTACSIAAFFPALGM